MASVNALLTHRVFASHNVIGTTKEEFVDMLQPLDVTMFLCETFNLSNSDKVYLAKWKGVGHYRIEEKNIVISGIQDGIPKFSYVERIVSFGDSAHLLTRKLTTHHFDSHFHAYVINYSTTAKLFSLQINDLKDRIPLSIHNVFYETQTYEFVSPRYIIFYIRPAIQ